jgi:hypothetical protein
MCDLPVESLQTSGILWFKDLTLADPYFLLPLLATGSMLAAIQVVKILRNKNLKNNSYEVIH